MTSELRPKPFEEVGALTQTEKLRTCILRIRYRPIVSKSSGALKAYMHAAAKTNKNQWMVEIDPRAEDLFPNIPQNLIKGWWYVDKDGRITDKFRHNSQWVDDELRTSE